MKTRRLRWLMGWLLLAVALLMPNPSGGAWAQTSVTTSKPAQGDGSSSNPFIISSAQELAWFRDWVNGTYTPTDGESAATHSSACAKISDDVEEIDLSTVCGESIGSWKPIGTVDSPWGSSFDGNHKTIKNLYINSSDKYQGLFGYIYNNPEEGLIKDICFKDVDANCSESNFGIIAGSAFRCTISGIQILSGTIKGYSYVGGITGEAYDCHLFNNENHINITASDDFVGGMIGYDNSSTIEKCTNQGNIELAEGSDPSCFGGIAGTISNNSTLSNCINSGNIKACEKVGGLIGNTGAGCILKSCITYGNVESTKASSAGLAIGEASSVQTLENVLYLSDATLKRDNQTVAAQAFGYAPSSGAQAIGLNQDLIKSGCAACLLQQSAGEDGVWGQQLGTDTYPVLGSAHTVYADNVSISCTGTIRQGSFTNTQPASGSQLITSHGTAIYHPAVAYTCTDNGSVAYYECSDCHETYNDEQLTEQLASTTAYTHGHEYAGDMCTLCQRQIPTLVDGTHAIQIEKVIGAKNNPGCYNLYKYIATSNGNLTVYTTGENDTYGTLWNSDLSKLAYDDDGKGDSNFKFTYEIEKGKTYYIGVRSFGGYAIEGDYQLTIKMDAEDGAEVLVGTLDGKDIMGTKQGDAYIVEHLDLADGQQMMLLKDNVQLQGGTYTRTFASDKWQPLYVPFELEVTEELLNDFELAAPNNLHEYELSDGSTKVVLEAKKMKSGHTIKALRPYLIRAKEAGEKTIQLTYVPLKGATEDTYVSCSSVLRLYKFIGTLKGKTTFDPTADFVLSQGIFYPADANAQLKPMRWYLNAVDSGTDMGINSGSSGNPGSEDDTSIFSRSIDISIVDGEPTTGIDDIHVITEQADGSFSAGNLSSTGSRRGIYDLQGRKLSKEPKSGIYIKDGKKMVR